MLVMNLLQSLLGRAVQLEFHHIDKLVSLQDKVNASFARMIFHLGIEADKLEYDEKHILVMQFLFADHFVGSIRKETLQTAEEGVIITETHLTDKFLNLKGRFHLTLRSRKKGAGNVQTPLPLPGSENLNGTFQILHHIPL